MAKKSFSRILNRVVLENSDNDTEASSGHTCSEDSDILLLWLFHSSSSSTSRLQSCTLEMDEERKSVSKSDGAGRDGDAAAADVVVGGPVCPEGTAEGCFRTGMTINSIVFLCSTLKSMMCAKLSAKVLPILWKRRGDPNETPQTYSNHVIQNLPCPPKLVAIERWQIFMLHLFSFLSILSVNDF